MTDAELAERLDGWVRILGDQQPETREAFTRAAHVLRTAEKMAERVEQFIEWYPWGRDMTELRPMRAALTAYRSKTP